MQDEESENFELFRDCLSTAIIDASTTTNASGKSSSRRRKGAGGSVKENGRLSGMTTVTMEPSNDAEDLAEFIDYLAQEIFSGLPSELQDLTYTAYKQSEVLKELYTPPLTISNAETILHSLPPSAVDSLQAYSLILSTSSPARFLLAPLSSYLTTLTTAPPPPSSTKFLATSCEICERDWIPLTYHHLIPRAMHAKSVKRGWHKEEDLQNVAWICRSCHSFVHRVATNEELAREYFTVERLCEREDVQAFAGWVARVRWKKR